MPHGKETFSVSAPMMNIIDSMQGENEYVTLILRKIACVLFLPCKMPSLLFSTCKIASVLFPKSAQTYQ